MEENTNVLSLTRHFLSLCFSNFLSHVFLSPRKRCSFERYPILFSLSLSLSLMEKPSKNHPTFFLNPSSYTIDSWPPDLSVSASRWLTIASNGNLPQDRFFVIGLPFFGILSSTGWRKTLGCFSLFLFFLFFFLIFLVVPQIDSSICILFPYIGNAKVVCLHVNFLFASYK